MEELWSNYESRDWLRNLQPCSAQQSGRRLCCPHMFGSRGKEQLDANSPLPTTDPLTSQSKNRRRREMAEFNMHNRKCQNTRSI